MLKKIVQLFTKNNSLKMESKLPHGANQFSDLPDRVEALKEAGDTCFKNREFDQADIYYKELIGIDFGQFEALKNLGVIQYYQKSFEGALKYYDQALALKPDYPEALSNRGLVLKDLKRLDESLDNLNQAISLRPDFPYALNNRGVTLKALKRFEDALKDYDRAIELMPNYAEAYNNRGTVLSSMKRYSDALESLDYAIKLKPEYAEAYCNRGATLKSLGKLPNALENFDMAIAINPNFAEAHYQQGDVLRSMDRVEESLTSFNRAIALKSDYADAYKDKGYALKHLKRFPAALAEFERAIQLNPNIELGYGGYCETKLLLCDWDKFDVHFKHIEDRILKKEIIAQQLLILWLASSPARIKTLIEIHTDQTYPPQNNVLPLISQRPRRNKIKIGYFSGDFYCHPVALLASGLFEKHDRSKFEIIAFSFTRVSDYMTQHLMSSFDRFIDVTKYSDREVAEMARELEIDIAIDLGGFTGEGSVDVFAMRAAPIQINYLGYPGTMGAEYMDYIIADETIIPKSYQQDYTEKIAYLPSFQVNDTKRKISDRIFTREELGLPSEGFVFCCFNNITKLNPYSFDSWMCILKQVENSVLWLLDENPMAVDNLRKEALARGVDGDRIVFAKRVSLEDYLARYRMADLFLDTLPYNAGTTASDALWAGLPVLTQIGEAFAGRMAASLLNAIHLPELITKTPAEYEALAIELATNPDRLAKIKQKLADNRLTTPLFDIDYFTKNIESAYTQMYERYHAGLAPDHIYVDNPYPTKQ